MLTPDSQNAHGLFVTGRGETLIGVGLAFVFGILLPGWALIGFAVILIAVVASLWRHRRKLAA